MLVLTWQNWLEISLILSFQQGKEEHILVLLSLESWQQRRMQSLVQMHP